MPPSQECINSDKRGTLTRCGTTGDTGLALHIPSRASLVADCGPENVNLFVLMVATSVRQ